MRKNRLFIFSSILIIISLFATAAACNLCGVPIEIGEATTEEAEARQQTTATTQGQSQGTEAPQSTETPAEGNNSPAITKIEYGGFDIDSIESPWDFDDFTPELLSAYLFTIEAYDEDGDELTYSAYDSLGANFDVTKIDNNNAELRCRPSLSHLGPYTLTIEVSDGKGGTDTYSIDMTFGELVLEGRVVDEPENNPPVISENLTIMGPAGEVTDLYTNQLFELSAFVSDPDEHAVTRTWSCEDGEFQSDHNFPTVLWKTPETAGEYEISLTANDSHGGITTRTWPVTVQEH